MKVDYSCGWTLFFEVKQGINSPVSPSYSYSYLFYHKGKGYKGDTDDSR